jgi:hypothetical protein
MENIMKTVRLSADLMARIADFRFNYRIKTENEAIRQLILFGLEDREPPQPEDKPDAG